MGQFISKPLEVVTNNRIRESCMFSSGIPQSLKDYNVKTLAMDLRRMGINIPVRDPKTGMDIDSGTICEAIKELNPNIDDVCMIPNKDVPYEKILERIIDMAKHLNEFFGIKIFYKTPDNKALPPQTICQQLYAVKDKIHDKLSDNIDMATKKLKIMRETLQEETKFIEESYKNSISSLTKAIKLDELGNFSTIADQIQNKLKNQTLNVNKLLNDVNQQKTRIDIIGAKFHKLNFDSSKIFDKNSIYDELGKIQLHLLEIDKIDKNIKGFSDLPTPEKTNIVTSYIALIKEYIGMFCKYLCGDITEENFKIITREFAKLSDIILRYHIVVDPDAELNDFIIYSDAESDEKMIDYNLSLRTNALINKKISYTDADIPILKYSKNGKDLNYEGNKSISDLFDKFIKSAKSENIEKADLLGIFSTSILFVFRNKFTMNLDSASKMNLIIETSESLLYDIGFNNVIKKIMKEGKNRNDIINKLGNIKSIEDDMWKILSQVAFVNFCRYNQQNSQKLYGGKKSKSKSKKSKSKKLKSKSKSKTKSKPKTKSKK
jgi:hypothetical protein